MRNKVRISDEAIQVLMLLEGYSAQPYQDVGGAWTIGWGHTLNVDPGTKVTKAKAAHWLTQDLMLVDVGISKVISRDLRQSTLDALALFAFNVGVPAFATSTLAKRLNAGAVQSAREELKRWCHVDGKIVKGLQVRRAVEAFVWQGFAPAIDATFIQTVREIV